MTMMAATVPPPTEAQPNEYLSLPNNRRNKPRAADGNRSNRRSQEKAGNGAEMPTTQSSRRGRKPRGQSNQQATQDNGVEGMNQEFTAQAVSVKFPITGIVEDGTPQDAAFNVSIMPGWNEVPPMQDPEISGVVPEGPKKQHRKKPNRPKNSGPHGQASAIDINQPRHPPVGTSNGSMRHGSQVSQVQHPRGQKSAQSSDRKPSPPEGIFGTTATPAKLYAGPTFHASPAPSSLPIPKFFSKSVPPPEKGPDMATYTPQESPSESSGSALEDSPTMKSSLRAEIAQVREPSPLDFFFNADRQEKAKRALGDTSGTPPNNRAQSSSPLPQSSRAHSRHPTGGSIFPMELENAGIPKTPNERRAESSPQVLGQEQNVAEKARAKTEALKQLLQFGPRQSSSPLSQSASLAQPDPLFSPPGQASHARQTSSGHSTPSSQYSYGNPPTHSQGPFPPPPRPSFSPQNTRTPPSTRALSSQLRNEVPAGDNIASSIGAQRSVEPTSVFPPTYMPAQAGAPSPSRPSIFNPVANPSGWSGHRSHSSSQQAMSTAAQDEMLRASLAQHVSPSNSAIEDELRKILKITPLPTGTTS